MTAAIVLDAGALIALDRNDRRMWASLQAASDRSQRIRVPAGVIAQAWRDGSRQALLSAALRHCSTVPLDDATARAAGLLCGQSGTADVIDATVALAAASLARSTDTAVFTSDPDDIARLADTLGAALRIEVV